MWISALFAAFGLAVLASTAPALSQSCSFTPSTTGFPALTGRVTYQDDNAGQLYMYDFKTATKTTITQSAWNLTVPRNPIFSRDGKAIIFSAVQSSQRHLYYWTIGAANPTNLTAMFGNHVNEDPHFAPLSSRIVFKRDSNIWIADLQFDGSGTPSLANLTQLTTTGVQGTSTEASDPNFSPSEKFIYFYTGIGSGTQLQRFNTVTGVAVAIPKTAGIANYYPVDVDLYDYFYVSWLSTTNTHDKIYIFYLAQVTPIVWNAADCNADNSDPAPVDEATFIYSRKDPAESRYQLFLGVLANGAVEWNITALNGVSSDLKGANYTNAR